MNGHVNIIGVSSRNLQHLLPLQLSNDGLVVIRKLNIVKVVQQELMKKITEVTGILNSFAMAVSKDSELPTTPQQKKEVKNLIKENKREKRKKVRYNMQYKRTIHCKS